MSLDDLFNNGICYYKSSRLKERLLKEAYKIAKCEKCHRTEHFGMPIYLEIHHINGDEHDNRIENIQILCLNCHSLTPNYAWRKNKNRRENKFSDQEIRSAVQHSTCITHMLRFLGYKTLDAADFFRKAISRLNIPLDHWKDFSKLSTKGIHRNKNAKSIDYFLKDGSKITSAKLRIKLVQAGLKQDKCECCGIIDWDGQKLNFCLHHINGNKFDNRLENLQILCYNCHARTPNYKGKNINRYKNGAIVTDSSPKGEVLDSSLLINY